MFLKRIHELKREGMFPTDFYKVKVNMTLRPIPDKCTPKKENGRSTPLMTIYVKILNEPLPN